MLIGCDMNILQSPELPRRLREDESLSVALSDAAIGEMLKHEDWRTTMKLAMSGLQPYRERVSLTVPLSDALRIELDERRLFAAEYLLDADHSKSFRELMAALESATETDLVRQVDEKVLAIRSEIMANELNAEQARQRMKALVGPFFKLKPVVRKALNGKDADQELLECFVQVMAEQYAVDELIKAGWAAEKARNLIDVKPMLLRYMYLIMRSGLLLALKGKSWSNRSHKKDLNDLFDIDHALTASYCDTLSSNDAGAKAAYDSLIRMLNRSSADASQYFQRRWIELGVVSAPQYAAAESPVAKKRGVGPVVVLGMLVGLIAWVLVSSMHRR